MLIRGEPERIVGYVRVSTEEQAENRISIDSQIRLIEDDAGAKGQAVAAMFVEPGVSGRDDTRPEFNRMLAFVENPANRVAEVKVWSQSRLARSTETIIPTFARLRRAKVRLVSLTQSISDDPTGHLMRVVIAGFDEHFAAVAPWCGVLVVSLATGAIVEWVRLEGAINELFDVCVLPGITCPMAIGPNTPEITSTITFVGERVTRQTQVRLRSHDRVLRISANLDFQSRLAAAESSLTTLDSLWASQDHIDDVRFRRSAAQQGSGSFRPSSG